MWSLDVLFHILISFVKIACATAGEARKWMEAFDHAKQEVQIKSFREEIAT